MRVFMTSEGKYYKAEEAAFPIDMEKGCVSTEGLEALPDNPHAALSQEEWNAAITALVNSKAS